MKEYIDLVKNVLENGEEREDRTGVGTISLFGTQTRYDLRKGFPLVTTRKVNFSSVVYEMLWFLSGSTDIKDLKCPALWQSWVFQDGSIGPGYGKQFRDWEYNDLCSLEVRSFDQIKEVIYSIKNSPNSRRHVVSAWNVADIEHMALPPCHTLFQFYVTNAGELDLQLYSRSCDLLVGGVFNIAGYSLLLTMIAQECNLTPRFFIHSIGDTHIYKNQVEQAKIQLERTPRALPTLILNPNKSFDQLVQDQDMNDFELIGYLPHAFIKYKVAV